MVTVVFCFFFFFQAEDGIRDLTVTGVQTCALPIWLCTRHAHGNRLIAQPSPIQDIARRHAKAEPAVAVGRSEERRVGKECRSRWSPDHYKKKKKTICI